MKTIKDTIFPLFCLGCEREGFLICPICQKTLIPYARPGCVVCDMLLTKKFYDAPYGKETLCKTCCSWLELDEIFVALDYQEPLVRKLIHALKYQFISSAAWFLAQAMVDATPKAFFMNSASLFVPVPLHKRRRLERGFNQAEVLCRAMQGSFDFHGTVSKELLKRRCYTTPQVEFEREERLKNVEGSFALGDSISAARAVSVILVDDVLTTGATLRECARVLRKAGFQNISALVAAKG